MCLSCCTNAISYGEIIPGFHLEQAQTSYRDEWEAGVYGITEFNSPTYFLKGIEIPAIDPVFEMTDEQTEKAFLNKEIWDASEIFTNQLHLMFDILTSNPKSGWRLYESALKSGYDEKTHGCLEGWFLHKIACKIRDITGA